MTTLACILAAIAGALALYSRGSYLLGIDSTPLKVAVSGLAAGILAWSSLRFPQTSEPVQYLHWFAVVLVGVGTAAGHAGWTGLLHPLGNHDRCFGLLRGDWTWRDWVSGALTGAQVTMPMAVLLAVEGAFIMQAPLVLLAGAAKPLCYLIGGRLRSAPVAEALHAGVAWAAMLGAVLSSA